MLKLPRAIPIGPVHELNSPGTVVGIFPQTVRIMDISLPRAACGPNRYFIVLVLGGVIELLISDTTRTIADARGAGSSHPPPVGSPGRSLALKRKSETSPGGLSTNRPRSTAVQVSSEPFGGSCIIYFSRRAFLVSRWRSTR